jgi:hypothetical protein
MGSRLPTAGPHNRVGSGSVQDVFVRDTQAGTTTRASVSTVGAQATGASSAAATSSDGHVLAFVSSASNLVSGDTNGFADVFARDLVGLTTGRVPGSGTRRG